MIVLEVQAMYKMKEEWKMRLLLKIALMKKSRRHEAFPTHDYGIFPLLLFTIS